MMLSVVVSFRNEQDVLEELIERLTRALETTGLSYEIVFVDDDSTDRSSKILQEAAARDKHIKIVTMSRRFGVEPCLFGGMRHAKGDAVITIDADLQDPPELIPTLVDRWKEGHDVVYTVRTARLGEPQIKLWLTRIAYHAIHKFAEIHIPVEAGDFRLLSRRVVDLLMQFDEPNTYLRGLVAWVGFPKAAVSYTRQPRRRGETHFSVFSRGPISTLFYGITGFSAYPVYGVVGVGVVACTLALLGLVGSGVKLAVTGDASGVGLWLCLATAAWGSLLVAIGVVGLYVTRIHRTTLGRPRYVVKSTTNITEKP